MWQHQVYWAAGAQGDVLVDPPDPLLLPPLAH
jgi:hypothetical protein